MTAQDVGFALMLLGVLLLVGKFLRVTCGPLQRLFLPSSIIAGSLGLLLGSQVLGRLADPEHRSPALEAFGYKQLLFEPIVAGGLFTAVSVPLIFQFGPWPVLLLAAALTLSWGLLGASTSAACRNPASTSAEPGSGPDHQLVAPVHQAAAALRRPAGSRAEGQKRREDSPQ
ncbi:MAG: hypothetical protein R3280_03835 [Marinobacter sp.]|uniref:hypothetical protein n=1 Tax=Marinobacter sp. TaxID=50741 RepID=UPI00299E1F1A|nr:hypothetical protein [Marinobacter sp.]MDX1633741.1 hypothetical protein [Marinobacter sp.]